MSRGSYKQSVLAGEAILNSKITDIIHVSTACFQCAWVLYQKYRDKHFSFTDVTSFAIIKDLNIKKAFSLDKDFTQAGIELVT